jgi:hypothetical protein
VEEVAAVSFSRRPEEVVEADEPHLILEQEEAAGLTVNMTTPEKEQLKGLNGQAREAGQLVLGIR